MPAPLLLSRRHRAQRFWAAVAGAATLLALLPGRAAAQINASAQREIASLLQAVGKSGCQFIRGGTAHAADKAQEHLNMKYEYMVSRNMLVSTEDFIEKAATRSTMTGELYTIRCGEAPPQRSDEWLKARLKAMRTAPPA